jgi:hypothetical protein
MPTYLTWCRHKDLPLFSMNGPLRTGFTWMMILYSYILYRVGGTCRVYRLHHSIVHSLFIADYTSRYYNHSFTLDSDPLISCVRAVFRCPLFSSASSTHWLSVLPLFCTDSLSLSCMLRPTVSRPVSLGIKYPSGAYDQIFIAVRNTEYVWQLSSWFRWAPFLTRGRVCPLYVPLVLASAVFLGS